MNSFIKQTVKQIFTFVMHPITFIILFMRGCKKLYIGPRLYINNLKYIKVGNSFYCGHDARYLFIKNYSGYSYNPSLLIGENVTIENRFTCLCADSVEIQDNCLIASDVFITTENHGMNPEISNSYANQPLSTSSILIEEGCWLGEKVCILPGVRLGKRSIVAAGSIVNSSFPPYSLIGGVPARLIKAYNFRTHKWEKLNAKLS